jgi:hypothetical protein
VQKSAGSRPGAVHDALCPLGRRGDLCFLRAGDRVGPGCVWAGRSSASGEVPAMMMVPGLHSGPRVGSDVPGRAEGQIGLLALEERTSRQGGSSSLCPGSKEGALS